MKISRNIAFLFLFLLAIAPALSCRREEPAAAPVDEAALAAHKARLGFHLIDEKSWQGLSDYRQAHPDFSPASRGDGTYTVPKEFNPPGTVVLRSSDEDEAKRNPSEEYFVVLEKPALSGLAVETAVAETNPMDRSPEVLFIMGDYLDEYGVLRDGVKILREVTEKNKGRWLAIVFDRTVLSHALIYDSIPNGRVKITGRFNREEAEEIAAVLSGREAAAPEK